MAPIDGVQIELGGEVRVLRFTNRNRIRLEMLTGSTIPALTVKADQRSLTALSRLVWAASLHADEKLDPDTVVDWIDATREQEIGDAIGKAALQYFGVDDEESPAEGGADEGKAEAATD